MVHVIYKATCSVNGKAYVGYTSNFQERKRKHLRAYGTTKFHRAIRKYGAENFIWEILYEGTNGEYTKMVLEPKFIIEHKTFWKDGGYNLTQGGEGTPGHFFKHTEESKKRISEFFMGNKYASAGKGKKHSPEHIAKVAESNRGQHRTLETRAKMSAAKKGKKATPEQRTRMSLAQKARRLKEKVES